MKQLSLSFTSAKLKAEHPKPALEETQPKKKLKKIEESEDNNNKNAATNNNIPLTNKLIAKQGEVDLENKVEETSQNVKPKRSPSPKKRDISSTTSTTTTTTTTTSVSSSSSPPSSPSTKSNELTTSNRKGKKEEKEEEKEKEKKEKVKEDNKIQKENKLGKEVESGGESDEVDEIDEESEESAGDSDVEIETKVAGKSVKPKSSTTKKATKSKGSTKKKNAPEYEFYDPIQSATWKKGENVPYSFLCAAFEKIEATPKRLEITEITSNVFRSVIAMSPNELLPTVYLVTNQLAPAYEGIELGVGEGVMIKTLANVTGKNEKFLREKLYQVQDLGILAKTSRSAQKTMFQPKPLTVKKVYEDFLAIAKCSGKDSQTKKQQKITELFVASKGAEAQYIVRALSGNLRIGLQQQTAIVALAKAFILTPPNGRVDKKLEEWTKNAQKDDEKQTIFDVGASIIKQCLCEYPSYEAIVNTLLEHGLGSLHENCHLTVGIPVKPMLAKASNCISMVLDRMENCEFTCEYKYDGERAQIHLLPNGQILIYSRNLENNTEKFPDLIQILPECLNKLPTSGEEKTDADNTPVTSCILDCEVVGIDLQTNKFLPFQILSTRARKAVTLDQVKVSVCLQAFDLLYLNGKSLIDKTFRERRELLRNSFHEVPGKFYFATSIDPADTTLIESFLNQAVSSQCEGLMVKTLDIHATYQPSRRSYNWLKLKKDYLDNAADSFDLVPIGAWYGKGKRTGTFGAFLLACYDPDEEVYQTICKVGTGFSDENLTKFHESLSKEVLQIAPSYYKYDDSHAPDVWLNAAQVWEIRAADLSLSPAHQAALGLVDPNKGIALRFPRFMRIRDDKSVEDATTSEQVAEMFKMQALHTTGGGNDDDY